MLTKATIDSDGVIKLPASSWKSEDGRFLRGLIAEYEQLMGAAGLTNANRRAHGRGEFKKLPVFKRLSTLAAKDLQTPLATLHRAHARRS